MTGVQTCALPISKKYRGKMKKIASQLIKDYADSYALKRDTLWLVYTIGLQDEIRISAEETAKECGFLQINWI